MNCTTLSLGLILFLTTSAAPREAVRVPSVDPLLQTDGEDSVAHEVEVMRRLLVKSIGVVPGESVNDAGAFTMVGNWASFSTHLPLQGQLAQGSPTVVTHSRGFRVPGTGVIYTMDVQVPARAVAGVPVEEPEEGVDEAFGADEWEAAARDVRGDTAKGSAEVLLAARVTASRRIIGFPASTATWELDPDALDQVIEAVLGTLARHGTRIGNLRDDESITVALQVTASSSSYPWRTSLWPTSVAVGEDEDQWAVGNYWLSAAANQARAALERTVVMQLSRKILGELAGSKTVGADVRKRALVHSY